MKLWSQLVCIALVSLIVSPALAQNAGKGKGRQAINPLLKAAEGLELTDVQKTKVAALGKEFTETMVALREKGYTQALNKQKNEAMKKAREAGKKGKELQEETFASLKVTDAQKDVLKQAAEAQSKLHKGLAATLTKEQIDKLPQQAKQTLTRAMPKGKAARNKQDAT